MSVILSGTESGTVTSSPAGIVNCQINCSAVFPGGTTVTLTAIPGAGSTFRGWSGECGGTGNCTVLMNGNRFITTTFGAATLNAVATFAPVEGPSGTRVYIRGRGFSPKSTVTFGAKSAAVTFLSATHLAAVAPLQDGVSDPLPPGSLSLAVDGLPLGLFMITELPQNPNPQGSLLTTAIEGNAAEFDQLKPNLETKLDSMLAATQDLANDFAEAGFRILKGPLP